jgi:hypothetical protein
LRYECGKAPTFFCDFCNKPFHQKSNLKVHMRRCKLFPHIPRPTTMDKFN